MRNRFVSPTMPIRLGRLALGLAVGVSMLSSTAARADDEAPQAPFEIGVFGGGHFFNRLHWLGRADDEGDEKSPKSSFTLGLRAGWNFHKHLALEAEFAFASTKNRDLTTPMTILSYRAQLLYDILGEGKLRPFVTAGFGWMVSRVDDRELVDNDIDTVLHAGIGVKYAITDMIGVRFDGRIIAPPAAFSGILKVGDESAYDGPDWEALLSVYVALGAGEKAQPPPPAPAPPPPPPPVDDDPDKDGIKGDADKCPDKAEDKDGFEDEDGCPEPDNDGDGILDGDDKCPNKAENKNGVDDEDGCPEEDTDGDGFFGSADKCPDAPETKNNYKDDDGCPDEIPAAVKKFTGVIEGINFKTGSAVILRGSYPLLDRAVEVLKEFNDVRMEISGHTDDRGKDDMNQTLSQKRAESVKAYFVGKGIADNRLVALGQGETAPIADNKTSGGRAKNRRTEFKLINSGK